MGTLRSVLSVFLLIGGGHAFVFSCEEVIYKLANANLQEPTQFVCLVTEDGKHYKGGEAFKDIYVQNDKVSTSFYDIWNSTSGCVERPGTAPWRVVADLPINIDCKQEFILIFTSKKDDIYNVESVQWMKTAGEKIIVSPQPGIQMTKDTCTGDGNLTVYTGAGKGVGEFRFHIKSWSCADFPEHLVSFENVITIVPDPGVVYAFYAKNNAFWGSHETTVAPSDRVVVMSSGYSDNLQNLHPEKNIATFNAGEDVYATITRTAAFDDRYDGHVDVTATAANGSVWTQCIRNESTSTTTLTQKFKFQYSTIPFTPQDIWDSYDHFVIEVSFTEIEKPTPAAPTIDEDPFCRCPLDNKFGMPEDWNSTDIWLDVVIILDTSEAMGAVALGDASSLIESFIGNEDEDVIITNTKSEFYTRVGLIAMSDKPEVIYNLNMTKDDTVKGKVAINSGVSYIDVVAAFNAAVQMLNDGMTEDRACTRQVIYYMTDSDPKFDSRVLDGFKTSRGKIIVNNFLEPGETERQSLQEVASPGYYYKDIQYNYMSTIQLFCKANCFCRPDTGRAPYPGGCFRPVPVGVPYSKMKTTCEEGLIASIHDADKAAFVAQQFALGAPTSDYFWIGYSKSDDGWAWEDKSSNPYTHWDVDNGEPNTASVAKCAYVDTTSSELFWGAGNCNVGFPSVCEYRPCEVGNKIC